MVSNFILLRKLMPVMLFIPFVASLSNMSCKSINKTEKGGLIGTAGGTAIGTMIGKASGNGSVGTIIGARVGGVTGEVIGRKMDRQADDIRKEVSSAKVERVEEGIVVEFRSSVLFGVNRADLSNNAEKTLNALASLLARYPDTNVEIQGHTDNKGNPDYNQLLSERRANAVARYLSNKDVSATRITTRGLGETVPRYANTTESGKSSNRRVEFLISANEKMIEEARNETSGKSNK